MYTVPIIIALTLQTLLAVGMVVLFRKTTKFFPFYLILNGILILISIEAISRGINASNGAYAKALLISGLLGALWFGHVCVISNWFYRSLENKGYFIGYALGTMSSHLFLTLMLLVYVPSISRGPSASIILFTAVFSTVPLWITGFLLGLMMAQLRPKHSDGNTTHQHQP